MSAGVGIRAATPDDALCLAMPARQVLPDTYPGDGVRANLAREALVWRSPQACAGVGAAPHFIEGTAYENQVLVESPLQGRAGPR